MDKNRDSVRDKLETMWFFHRQIVIQFLIADTITLFLLTLVAGETSDMLPAYSVPCFSIVNFILANRRWRMVQFELPLGLFVAFGFSTFIALINCMAVDANHGHALFGAWIGVLFFVLFGFITTCIGIAIYALWSENEMEAQVRRHHFRMKR